MKLYPPFKHWSTEITDRAAFRSYMRLFEDGGVDGLEGTIGEHNFKVEKSLKYRNNGRPQIHGQIINLGSKKVLKVHLESYDRPVYAVGVF